MALRTNTYASLTLERITAAGGSRASAAPPEFVYLVLYHGDGPWRAPDHVTDLFERSDPGRFRLVSWREREGAGRPRNDITALVLGLARNLSPEEMAAQVAALRLRVAERGDTPRFVRSESRHFNRMSGSRPPLGQPWNRFASVSERSW